MNNNSTKKLISFCCLSYNHENYIEQCIRSIWNQNYNNIEILALDDGSKDNSVSILNRLKEQSPCPMTIIAQENCGNIGSNFNKLIKRAKGELIAFIACDDAFIDNSFEEKLNMLNQNNNLALVCHSKITYVDENNNLIENADKQKLDTIVNPKPSDILELEYSELHSFYIQGAIFRKEIIDTIGGFEEDMIADDIVLRTKYLRYIINHPELEIKVFNNSGVYYRRHSSNISSNIVRQIRSVTQYLSRFWDDREPPEILYNWIDSAIINNNDISKIFFTNEYVVKILKNILADDFINNRGFCHKKSNILGVIKYYKYTLPAKTIRIIKLFNFTIYKSVKHV